MYFRFGTFFKSIYFSCNVVYPFSIFIMFFGCHILFKIVRFLLHPVFGVFSCHSLPIVDRSVFRCFGKSRFVCIMLPFVDISVIFLHLPELSGLFPHIVLIFFLCCVFLFPAYFSASLSYYSASFS